MKVIEIQLLGNAGNRVTMQRTSDGKVRIDSTRANPGQGERGWETYELEASTHADEAFRIAMQVQHRADGYQGTNSDVRAYFSEINRLMV